MRTHGARPTIYGLTLALVGALLLAACGGSRGAASGTPGYRVGLVTDVGKIDDRSLEPVS